jgi:hypothetical protein
MPLPENYGNGPEFAVPYDPWDDAAMNPDQDAYEQVVARSLFSGTSPLDGGMYSENGQRLEAVIVLQALTYTTDITISVLLPAGLDFVGKGSDDGSYIAGSREIRWVERSAVVGVFPFRSYTVTVNQPSLPAQLFITTRISGPGVAAEVVRVTPVWVGASVSQVAASGADTTLQPTAHPSGRAECRHADH